MIKIDSTVYPIVLPESDYNFWDIFNLLTKYNTAINAQLNGFGTWTFSLTGNSNKFV